jgi:hypothetical protein
LGFGAKPPETGADAVLDGRAHHENPGRQILVEKWHHGGTDGSIIVSDTHVWLYATFVPLCPKPHLAVSQPFA